MKKIFFYSFVGLLAITLCLPSCKEKRRSSYLVPDDKRTDYASPYVQKIISKKNGIVLASQLEAVEQAAQKELEVVEETAKKLQKEARKRRKKLSAKAKQRIKEIRKEHKQIMEQFKKDLALKTKEAEKNAYTEVDEFNTAHREKELTLVDQPRQRVMEKVNQAEMELLDQYIKSKQRTISSATFSPDLENWKRQKMEELEQNINYLTKKMNDDFELQRDLIQKKTLIEAKITDTLEIGDESYASTMKELEPLTVMRKAYNLADQMLLQALDSTQLSSEDQEHVHMIIQAELPAVIQKAVASKQEISPAKVQKIVLNAIENIQVEPAHDALEKERDRIVKEKVLQKKLALLKDELVNKEKEKLSLKIEASKINQQQALIENANAKALNEMQGYLDTLKQTVDRQTNQQQKLKETLMAHQNNLKASALSTQEKDKKIKELQEYLNKSKADKFKSELEAAKLKNMQIQLNKLRSSLDSFKDKHKQSQHELAKNQETIKRLEKEKKYQEISSKIKEQTLKREKELLRKRNLALKQVM